LPRNGPIFGQAVSNGSIKWSRGALHRSRQLAIFQHPFFPLHPSHQANKTEVGQTLEFCFPLSAKEYSGHMKNALLIVLLALSAFAQPASPPADLNSDKTFNEVADSALIAMTKRAEELKIKGAAVVAYIEGESTKSWSSKMVVVGAMKNAPTEKNHGANLLAIAYSKAAEMAETLKDSGKAGRPPMTGETGWQGGLIKKGKTGYLIAAFSGGPSESDLKVSQAGLEVLAGKF
jgi:hypothetical protein